MRRWIILGIWLLAGTWVASAQTDSITISTAQVADRIIYDGIAMTGTPYRYGANGPKAYDCSAFTGYLFKKYGYKLARSAAGQSKDGRPVEGDFSNFQKGDLIIFGARHNPRRIGHVGIFIELDSTGRNFSFLHTAVKGGVQVSQLKESYYASRFLGARRILPDFITDVEADSLTHYAFALDSTVVPVMDTLTLAENDKRIVLLQNGQWVYVQEDGTLLAPDSREKLVLEANGTWSVIPLRGHTIPSIDKKAYEDDPPQAQPAQVSTRVAAQPQDTAAAAASPATPAAEEYYTIKSGDSLYRIARNHHTTVDALCRLNGITPQTILKVGKRIRVR